MGFSLNTLHKNGSFNFFSNLIEIDKYTKGETSLIVSSLSSGISRCSNNLDLEIITLFHHEATHFLDLTTTLWGLEFISRKHHFLASHEIAEINDAFLINASEILIHFELLQLYEEIDLLKCDLNYSYEYDDMHGAHVKIYFFQSGRLFFSVPLSMLSILEANALASEILVEHNYIEETSFGHNKEEGYKKLEKKIEQSLGDYNQVEYSLFLILIKKHFTFLNVKDMALFTQELIRFVLNLSCLTLSTLIESIFVGIKNSIIGASVCEDFARGSSRHIAAMYLIFSIYNKIEDQTINEKKIIELLSENSNNLMYAIFEIISPGSFSKKIDELELEVYVSEIIKNKKGTFDYQIIKESIENNIPCLKSKLIGLSQIHDFRLPDFLLADGTEIKVPNRIDINVTSYFDTNLGKLTKLDSIFKELEIYKPHPPLSKGPISSVLLGLKSVGI